MKNTTASGKAQQVQRLVTKKLNTKRDCANHQTKQPQKRKFPDGEALFRQAGGVTFEVKESSHDVEKPKRSAKARMPNSSQNHKHEEERHHFQRILVPSLDTIEDLSILVLGFESVQIRVKDLILLASAANLTGHPEIEKGVENKNEDDVAIFSGEKLDCSHFRRRRRRREGREKRKGKVQVDNFIQSPGGEGGCRVVPAALGSSAWRCDQRTARSQIPSPIFSIEAQPWC